MRGRIICIGIALAPFAFPCLSEAADGGGSSVRTCHVKVGSGPSQPCRQLIYSRGPRPGVAAIAANIENGQVTFSGTDIGTHALALTGIYDKHPYRASGKCTGAFPRTGRLGAAKCIAHTELGLVSLMSTGDDPHDIALIIGKKIHK